VGAGSAKALQLVWIEPTVDGEGVGVAPQISNGALAHVALDEIIGQR
jgi:hypothetical protein